MPFSERTMRVSTNTGEMHELRILTAALLDRRLTSENLGRSMVHESQTYVEVFRRPFIEPTHSKREPESPSADSAIANALTIFFGCLRDPRAGDRSGLCLGG
jgi:hypothetical protein